MSRPCWDTLTAGWRSACTRSCRPIYLGICSPTYASRLPDRAFPRTAKMAKMSEPDRVTPWKRCPGTESNHRPGDFQSPEIPRAISSDTGVLCSRRASLAGERRGNMPRYMVERSFPDGLNIPLTEAGAQTCLGVVGRNAELGVTWVHSYVSEDKRKTFCVYDAPSPEAIRKAAERSELPVEKITKVAVLDPYFYR